jgi:hypothetical protein
MTTTVATAIAQGDSSSACAELISSLRDRLHGESPVLLLAFASTAQPLGGVAATLSKAWPDATFLGATTAGEFTEAGDAKSAVAACAVAGDFKIYAGIGTGLGKDPEAAVTRALEGVPRDLHGYPHKTAILMLDPLAGNGEETTLLAAGLLGEGVRLAGGAAGDDLKMKSTQVACGERVSSDAVVIALVFSKQPLGVGVCHGHSPISKPLRVTRAEGAVVHEVEGRPAWDVWVEQTRSSAKARGIDVDKLAPADLGSYLLRYEASLAAGSELKIRAPLVRNDDGSIQFACGIPEGSVVRITESLPEKQVESAIEAARRARAQLGGHAAAGAIVFDCICRNLILGEDFARAVKGISAELGNVPLAGFETYGEIALDVGDLSGFHNTTSVVLAFPR